MKAVAKGNKFELEAKKTLEADGWKVFRQHRKPLFINGKMIVVGADIFGCDLVAKKAGRKTVWVQVSTKENLAAKKKQIEEHPLTYEHEIYEVWIRVEGRKVFSVYQLMGEQGWTGPHEVPIREIKNVG